MKRGRPQKYFTDEERKIAQRIQRKKYYHKNRQLELSRMAVYRSEHYQEYLDYQAEYRKSKKEANI